MPATCARRRTGQAGFTLLEVLLAFLVFGLSFAVTLEILTGSMRNTARAREYTEAALIAQSLMDQVGLDIPLEAGNFEGEEGNYRWEVAIYPFQDDGSNTRSMELMSLTRIELLEVECLVSWGNAGRERSQMFSTVKARLEGNESGEGADS
jgi:general secretion pathway protein I